MPRDEVPAASVILVTRDRREEIEAALDSLGAPDRFEVIVVDDGSRDDTWEMLSGRPSVVAIRRASPGGPGVARNEGAARARGRVLVFLDSDCRALPGWLDAMLAPLDRPEVGAVGGAEALDPLEPLLGRVFHFVLTSPLTTGRIRGGVGGRAAKYRPRGYSLAVRRSDFERVGGFSARRHGEDIDLVTRIEGLGMELVHAPDARVHHRRRRTWRGFSAQLYAMGRARPGLALEIVYLLPASGLVVGALLLAAAAFLPPARIVAGAAGALLLVFLAAVGVAAAAALRSPAALLLAPLAFLVQQASYGFGFARGLLDRRSVPR